MTNFEKAVETVGIAGIVEMMGVYCNEATGNTCAACPWRKAVDTMPGCHCITSPDIVQFLESQETGMVEMVYEKTRHDATRIANGICKGFPYYVLSMGTHPCAYVDVSDMEDALDTNRIDCHGGITYSDNHLATVDGEGWFIGWDYAHWDDYNGMIPKCFSENFKLWTTQEIVEECKNVIDQIVELRSHKGGGNNG